MTEPCRRPVMEPSIRPGISRVWAGGIREFGSTIRGWPRGNELLGSELRVGV